MRERHGTIDPAEIGRFAANAPGWWDPEGSFRPLHRINRARLVFIRSRLLAHFARDPASLSPFNGLRLLDAGCGGGLVAEPMARLGFTVAGIDADEVAIAVARAHSADTGLAIDYRVASLESIAETGRIYDVVLALEIVEHLADPEPFFAALGKLLRPGGAFIGATLNRTPRAFALAIVGAEYILGWLPRGTHDWRKFLRPSEFALALARNGLKATEIKGISYDLLRGEWRLSSDFEVNYLVFAIKR